MFNAMFVFLFGVFTAAQGASMLPNAGKALKSAIKIWAMIKRPSRIDVLSTTQ